MRHASLLVLAGVISFNAQALEWFEILNVKPDAKPYEILGLPKNAKTEEIREAFRAVSRKFHPDKWIPNNGLGPCKPTNISRDEAEAVMKAISTANDALAVHKTNPEHTQTGGKFSKDKRDYTFKFKESDSDFYWLGMSFDEVMRSHKPSAQERESQLYAVSAAIYSDINALKYAMALNFDLNTRNAFIGGSYLEAAVGKYVKGSNLDFLKFLLDQTIDVSDSTVMRSAVERGLLEVIKLLHKKGMPIRGLDSSSHHKTVSVREIALENGHKDIVDWYDGLKSDLKK